MTDITKQFHFVTITAGNNHAAGPSPVSLAYASLAGLPPQHGIYCYLDGLHRLGVIALGLKAAERMNSPSGAGTRRSNRNNS